MPKAESYNDLIFQLGDLARERLANKSNAPRAMDRVFRAEEALVARQNELQELEAQMNDEDAAYQDFVAQVEEEKAQNAEVSKRFKKAVDAIEGKVKELRKKMSSTRADIRYGQGALKVAEKKHADFEMAGQDPAKVELSRQNLKKLRLAQMRQERQMEELEHEFQLVFEVRPGQPGAEGILAHKRILELEDEVEARKAQFEDAMADLDQAIATKEEELKAAEDYLDQALFMLGEECYAQRLADPALAAFYPRLDNAQ